METIRQRKRLLVVAAHPDDEVLGAGATVALRVRQGWEASLVILATGATGRLNGPGADGSSPPPGPDTVKALTAESDRAGRVLGFSGTTRLALPDNGLDTVPRMDLVRALKPILEEGRPDVVFTHWPGDYNWDHLAAFEAVLMAARPSPGEHYPEEILAFETLSSTERGWQSPTKGFLPTVFVDVASTIDLKKRALACYASECRAYPHPRSLEGVEYLARKRGLEVGTEYAEAFQLIRRIESRI